MKTKNNKNQRLRKRLYETQKGLCFWCGLSMVLIENAPSKVKNPPDNMCTIEHLESRWHPERGNFNGSFRKVAACLKCNNDRDAKQLATIPRELLDSTKYRGIKARELVRNHVDKLRPLFPVIVNSVQRQERVFTFEPKPVQENNKKLLDI